MSRILKLQALSIASDAEVGEGESTSSANNCTCSTTSAIACKDMGEFTAV